MINIFQKYGYYKRKSLSRKKFELGYPFIMIIDSMSGL